MKKAILVCCLLFPMMGFASSDSHRRAAEELLIATNMKETLDRTIVQIVNMQARQNPKLAQIKHVMVKFFRKYMGYESTKHDLVQIYVEEFTESELKQITAFYRTPVGQKSVRKLPALMQKASAMNMAKVRQHMPELQAMIKQEMEKNRSQR